MKAKKNLKDLSNIGAFKQASNPSSGGTTASNKSWFSSFWSRDKDRDDDSAMEFDDMES